MATLSSIITPTNITTASNTQTLTNKTITGGIYNGTVGATTASTGAFTTLSATGAITGTTETLDSGSGTPATAAAGVTGLRLLTADATITGIVGDSYGSVGLYLIGRASGGTRAARTATPDGTSLAILSGHGFEDSTTVGNASRFSAVADGLWSASNHGVYWQFDGTSNASTTRTAWMTLRNGNLGIGTTSPTNGKLVITGSAVTTAQGIRLTGDTADARFICESATIGAGILGTFSAHSQLFYTNSTERMRISSAGDLSITGTAQRTLTIIGDSDNSGDAGYTGITLNWSGSERWNIGPAGTGTTSLVFRGASSNVMTLTTAGALTITGALSKGSGSFRIEHPLPSKSATHQLVHSFIEGPKCDLIYRGKINLVDGKATVNIDTDSTMTEGTFEVLCANVQCFTSNESGWGAIRGKVVGNILTIEAQDAASTDNVSWMVIGERKDKHIMDTDWTDNNGRPVVEPLKPAEPALESK